MITGCGQTVHAAWFLFAHESKLHNLQSPQLHCFQFPRLKIDQQPDTNPRRWHGVYSVRSLRQFFWIAFDTINDFCPFRW